MKTAGTFDNKLMLVDSSADVTADANGSAVDFNGPIDMDELNYRIIVPSVSGTSPTLDIKIQGSDDQSNWTDLYAFPQITAAGEYSHKFRGTGRYRRAVIDVGGTSPNFGKVKIGASAGGVF